jgi:hypothetical protein
VDVVNTYDPMDRMVYRHVGQPRDVASRPTAGTDHVTRLPIGYANGSPGTYLGRGRRTTEAA